MNGFRKCQVSTVSVLFVRFCNKQTLLITIYLLSNPRKRWLTCQKMLQHTYICAGIQLQY